MNSDSAETCSETIFVGNSEMALLMRSHNWSQTSLGSVETWPQSLRSALSICLNSRFPIAIYWGADGLLLYNDAWRPIVGNKHPWALGRSGREVWSEIWDDIGPELASVLATGEGTFHKDELLSMYRFGYTEECFFEYTFNPIRGEGGGVDGVFNIVTETTYRVLNDRRARLLREVASKTGIAKTVEAVCTLMLEALQSDPFDIPFALLYLVDPDGKQARLCDGNPLTSDRAVSPAAIDLMAEDSNGWPIALVARTAQPQVITNLAARFGTLPGSPWAEPPQEAVVLPILVPGHGKVSGVLVAVASPRRKLDDNYQDFFTQVAGQLATAIANAQAYEEERKRAEALAEIDRAKTTFFSNVSHEFRTPLTLMLGPLEDALVRVGGDGEVQSSASPLREQLQLAHRNGLRLLKLVNTLLDFSRIEAGRIQAVYEPTDLAGFTAELASGFRATIEQAGLRFVVDCPRLAEPAYVDREMWEKIVLNLLSNAFKFTFEGEIQVSLHQKDTPTSPTFPPSFVLEVRDTGTGIPAKELPHIFERFHRVKGARGRSYEGSGIGLSLVQELVRLHGGTIEVNSIVDQGTCFTVSIPTGCAHLPSEAINATRTLTSTATGATPYVEEALRWLPEAEREWSMGDGENVLPASYAVPTPAVAKILIADDNADMRDYLKRLLKQYDVESVTDGIAAVAAVRQHLPDLMLADVMMPGLDGFGLLRALRADPQTQELPIILLSARAGEEARIEGLAAGADDYLTKPFSARELLARIEANLKLSHLRRETTQREQALRLEAETAKQAAEAAYQRINQILECMTDAFVAFDRNWCYTYANPAALQLLQKSSEDLIGKNVWSEVFPTQVDGLAYRELHRALAEQVSVSWEEFGEPVQRWLEVRAYPSPEGVAIYFQDITERKRTEAALRQSEEKLRLAVTAAQMVAWTWDARTDQMVRSETACEVLGLSLETLDGSGTEGWNLVHPDDRAMHGATVAKAIANRSSYFSEFRIVRPDNGAIIWVEDRGQVSFDEQGNLLSVEGILFDITARKQTESVRLRLAEEREQLLARERQARASAEQANRIKDEFLAIVSHELRSPLNPILGWSTLLLNQNLNPAKTTQALSTIARNAKLQAELIEDLLDVSRILRGKLSLNIRSINLIPTIQAALETVRLSAEAKSIQIKTALELNVGLVSGDSSRLQQVIWNLLSNAIKFTLPGGRVEVRLERVEDGEPNASMNGRVEQTTNERDGNLSTAHPYAQISISDTGKGIHPDFLPHVFDYFRQEDGATTRKFGGLGLGLAIVHHLVELHGGTVEAESPGEGQGATFIVKLPLLKSKSDEEKDGWSDPHPTTSPHPLTGLRILVVDDDADTQEYVTFLLEQAGAKVATSPSASEALLTLTRFQPDVLLSDIGMPDMDGYMLLRQVRALPPEQGSQVPAIALTAYAGEIDYQQAMAAGFQQHLAKPIEPQKLIQAIRVLHYSVNQT